MAQGLTTYTYPTIGEKRIFIFCMDYSSITSGSWVFTTSTSQWYNGYIECAAGAVGDSINYACYLNAGIYHLFLVGILATTRGIAQCSIDGVALGTFDTYYASTLFNRLWSYPGFTVTYPHIVTINIYATGKNAASSDERLGFTYIDIFQRGTL